MGGDIGPGTCAQTADGNGHFTRIVPGPAWKLTSLGGYPNVGTRFAFVPGTLSAGIRLPKSPPTRGHDGLAHEEQRLRPGVPLVQEAFAHPADGRGMFGYATSILVIQLIDVQEPPPGGLLGLFSR